jgi:hypothetical protein
MVNLTHPELAEISNSALPPASLDALKNLRNQSCEASKQSGFKLQSQQQFLRRVLSPDSPNRNLLMVHGTGTGKTCTAIQIAEEFILRPEFQDSKVSVVASRAVEENFRTQLFEIDRVNIDVIAGTLESKQCTGRRYLDMLLRIENEPRNWNRPEIREKLEKTADKLINEFYEFKAYETFGEYVNSKDLSLSEKDFEVWIKQTFNNRLLIIDEAHNIRQAKKSESFKGVASALEKIVKIADGLVLVLLTATPMFHTYEEIVYYLNLFMWNDKRQTAKEEMKASEFFNDDASLKPGERFRTFCSEYISYVKGDNPFTFPFRLPPPHVIDPNGVTKDFKGKSIAPTDRLKYLTLTDSPVQGIQREILMREKATEEDEKKVLLTQNTVAVLPNNKTFKECFSLVGKQYRYAVDPFLTPEQLPNHASKFVTILKSIEASKGVALVYSNFATMGAQLFAMALEEHGYSPAIGQPLFAESTYQGSAKGRYMLLTSEASDTEISAMLTMVKSPKNRDGSQIKIIIASPIGAEGIDFRYVRQLHVIDPWWNMSRVEQVIGRGLRTCSHQLLPFEDQNCTVYLHIVRTGTGKECFDEDTYRTKVEPRAIKIARVRKVMAESAMDCPIQNSINTLPEDWKNLEVPQRRAEDGAMVTYRLYGMMAPTFDEDADVHQCIVPESKTDDDHTRPLSTFLDVRDDLLSRLADLLIDKPIWDRKELIDALRPYTPEVVVFNLQQAISSGFRFKDSFNRPAVLESKGEMYALAPIGISNGTMIERTTRPPVKGSVPLPEAAVEAEAPPPVEIKEDLLVTKRNSVKFPGDALTRFSDEVLNGYVFDHEFTEAEKRAYLKQNPTTLPFSDRLMVPNTEIIVLGEGKYEPQELPVGSEGARLREWETALLSKFIDAKDKLFASVADNGVLTVSEMDVEGEEVKRHMEVRKRYEPIKCGTGKNKKDVMQAFAKYIDSKGIGAPASLKNAADLCKYTELLAREEHNVIWFTPEELSVLYEKKENVEAFKKAFTAAYRK